MSDPISKLRGLTDEIKARDLELRKHFSELSLRLQEAAGGHRIRGVSENCTLETYGDDDAYYGFLSFDEDGLDVAYRTRQEDMEIASNYEPWEEPTYHPVELEKCSPVW